MKTVKVITVPCTFEWSEEAKALFKRMDDPQDLEDALLSVKRDAFVNKLAVDVEAAKVHTMLQALATSPPSPPSRDS